MPKNFHVFSLLITLSFLFSCQKNDQPDFDQLNLDLTETMMDISGSPDLSGFILPESKDFSSIPQDAKNPLSEIKVELGRMLYHETRLAIRPKYQNNLLTYSCASCHHADAGFQAGIRQGIGEGGIGFGDHGEGRYASTDIPADSLDVQPVRTPSVLNIAYQPNVLWNGQFGATHLNVGTEAQWTEGTPKVENHLGFEGPEIQAIAGLKVHRMAIDPDYINGSVYKDYFDRTFANSPPEERYTRTNAGLAIAAYERTVLANDAPFQRWLKGESDAMSDIEKRGAILFFGKAGCVSCHNGPALSSMEFYALGMNNLVGPGTYGTGDSNPANLGRGGFTGLEDDNYKFKVPQLYNLKDSPFFGHGGTFTSVKEVVEYKNKAVAENSAVPSSQLAEDFVPLNLTEDEIAQITYFIEHSLYDPNLRRYAPASLPSGLCFPNNDEVSRAEIGCN